MPRSKAPAILQAADKYRRAEQRVTECERALVKARKARVEAEAEYLKLMAESLAAHQLIAARPGDGPPTPKPT